MSTRIQVMTPAEQYISGMNKFFYHVRSIGVWVTPHMRKQAVSWRELILLFFTIYSTFLKLDKKILL